MGKTKKVFKLRQQNQPAFSTMGARKLGGRRPRGKRVGRRSKLGPDQGREDEAIPSSVDGCEEGDFVRMKKMCLRARSSSSRKTEGIFQRAKVARQHGNFPAPQSSFRWARAKDSKNIHYSGSGGQDQRAGISGAHSLTILGDSGARMGGSSFFYKNARTPRGRRAQGPFTLRELTRTAITIQPLPPATYFVRGD